MISEAKPGAAVQSPVPLGSTGMGIRLPSRQYVRDHGNDGPCHLPPDSPKADPAENRSVIGVPTSTRISGYILDRFRNRCRSARFGEIYVGGAEILEPSRTHRGGSFPIRSRTPRVNVFTGRASAVPSRRDIEYLGRAEDCQDPLPDRARRVESAREHPRIVIASVRGRGDEETGGLLNSRCRLTVTGAPRVLQKTLPDYMVLLRPHRLEASSP